LIAGIYACLAIGAITMVYPFLLMISGSFKSNVDRNDFDVIPAFFHDDTVLYRKHLECKYNNSLTKYCPANQIKAYEFRLINPPEKTEKQKVTDWKEFETSAKIPAGWYNLGYMFHTGDRLLLQKEREFRAKVMTLAGNSLEKFNSKFDTHIENWLAVGRIIERPTERRYQLGESPLEEEFYRFKAEQPTWFRFYPNLDGLFVQIFIEPIYGRDIGEYNKAHGTTYKNYNEIILAPSAPENTFEKKDWERFVRDELNMQFIRISPDAGVLFAKFLSERYSGNLDLLNIRYKTAFKSFSAVPYPQDLLHSSNRLVDWSEFVRVVPVEHISVTSPEIEFRRFLCKKYRNLETLNYAHNSAYGSFDTVPIPARELDYADFLVHKKEIRCEFIAANYKQVIDYIFLHGRALMNTVIYCLLAVVFALTVNPMAAYALSRFKLPSTYKILLFCMATMAFPPAVAMIPNFLLLKHLDLLNTFAALILPGVANGFNIFLLKGFFDSLPRELYESAEIDGAGEWTIFWHITMSLSQPILAVLALGAFTAAYGNFMFAFILCPDEKMWTLMVFLYQLQIGGHMGLTFAALLVAAIPTFIAFILCQKVIMRGIVVPVEK
ncbi:MAG: carbohydrate ABC transporter permease, partial [Kiritimatiellae bacterium]|nr:carbohydrate ABC transporter permease [Kiritimatiellia bacterium]